MTEEDVSKLYTRLAFQYESVIDTLLAKGSIDEEIAASAKEKFYDSLDEENYRHLKESGPIMKLSVYI